MNTETLNKPSHAALLPSGCAHLATPLLLICAALVGVGCPAQSPLPPPVVTELSAPTGAMCGAVAKQSPTHSVGVDCSRLPAHAIMHLGRMNPEDPKRHKATLVDVRFVSREEVVGLDEKGFVLEWSLTSGLGEKGAKLPCQEFHAGVIAPDGNSLMALCDSGVLHHWQLHPFEKLIIEGQDALLTAMTFSPDGRVLLAGDDSGAVRILPFGEGNFRWEVFPDAHTDKITDIVLSPNGDYVATASLDGSVRILNRAFYYERSVVLKHAAEVLSLAYAPDGKTLSTGMESGLITVWTMGHDAHRVATHQLSDAVTALAISPDGKTLAAGTRDSKVVVIFEGSEQMSELVGHRGVVTVLAFSSDGERLASGSEDKTILVWDLASVSR